MTLVRVVMAGLDPAIQETKPLSYFVYILASKRNGALYIGVTNDLARRVFEHKQGTGSVFTTKYGLTCSSTLKSWRLHKTPFSVRRT